MLLNKETVVLKDTESSVHKMIELYGHLPPISQAI